MLIDTLCSEYGWALDYVLGLHLDGPFGPGLTLAQALTLQTAISLRYGNKLAGPSYRDREILAAIRAAKPK